LEESVPKHSTLILVLFASLATLSTAPAIADDGQIVITQAKALAGNVTPGDTPGFPVTLSQPGSYILAGNLQPPAGKTTGINIASNDVTIDLDGFTLNGAAVASIGISGGAFDSATIRNGTITGFATHGIFGQGDNWIVKKMVVVKNGGHGIVVYGFDSSVRGSTVTQNGDAGILCRDRCLIADSTVSANGGRGIELNTGTVLGNVIIGNTDVGMFSDGFSGFGNNTLAQNNGGVANQVAGGTALHPNACDPACP
jgi:hypothetical protein